MTQIYADACRDGLGAERLEAAPTGAKRRLWAHERRKQEPGSNDHSGSCLRRSRAHAQPVFDRLVGAAIHLRHLRHLRLLQAVPQQ